MSHDRHPHRTTDDPNLEQALRVIQSTYGDVVSVQHKAKNLLKFGHNDNVGTDATHYTIWETGQDEPHETYVADGLNTIDTVSSSNATDDQLLHIEGHTSDTDNHGITRKNFVVQNAILDGQNKVPLGTPLNRLSRIVNSGATDFAGEIYGYEDTAIVSGKPSDTTTIHLSVLDGNQSQKAATSLSYKDYWIVTQMAATVIEKSATFVDVDFQVRPQGGVFLTQIIGGVSASSGTVPFTAVPYLIVPPNADVRLTAVGTAAGTDVTAFINGYLAIEVSHI